MSKAINTDWTRLLTMKDRDIDTRDILELGDDFFQRAELRMPPEQAAAIRPDTDEQQQ